MSDDLVQEDEGEEKLTDADFAAADEVLARNPGDERVRDVSRKYLAGAHARLGRRKFRLIYALRKPVSYYEELIFQFWNFQISEADFKQKGLQHSRRPVDKQMLKDLYTNLERKLLLYSEAKQAVAAAYKDSVSPRERSKFEREATKKFEAASGKTRMMRPELQTLHMFLRRVRVEKSMGAAKAGGYTAATTQLLIFNVTGDALKNWRNCVDIAHRSQTRPEYLYSVHAARLFYKDGKSDLPPPRELLALLEQEIAAGEIKLDEMKARRAAASPVHNFTIASANVSVAQATVNGVSMPSEQDHPSKENMVPAMKVDSWSELGIGIDEKRDFYAIIPAPANGEVVRKADSKKVIFTSDQLLSIMEVFANKGRSNSVPVYEILRALDILPPPSTLENDSRAIPGEIRSQILHNLGALDSAWRSQLNNILSTAGHTLREVIDGPKGGNKSCFSLKPNEVLCRFTVRFLFPDASGNLRFGQEPEPPHL